jgi:hypothetical protein
MDGTVCRFAFLSLYPSSFSLLPFPRIPMCLCSRAVVLYKVLPANLVTVALHYFLKKHGSTEGSKEDKKEARKHGSTEDGRRKYRSTEVSTEGGAEGSTEGRKCRRKCVHSPLPVPSEKLKNLQMPCFDLPKSYYDLANRTKSIYKAICSRIPLLVMWL